MQIEKSSSDMKFLMYAIGEMTGLQCIIFYNCLHYKLSEIQGSLEKQGPQQKFPTKPRFNRSLFMTGLKKEQF